MANTLTTVIPQLLAQGLEALRENAVMARLVNTDYEEEAKKKGDTITIPIAAAITAKAVTPSANPATTADVTTTSTTIALDQWYEAPFYLTDKQQIEVIEGYLPLQALEAIKALIESNFGEDEK